MSDNLALRPRYHDPTTGRFNRADPFAGIQERPLSLHKYNYGEGNPVLNIDPSGNISLVGTVVNAGIRGGLISLAISAPFRAIGAAQDLAAGASLREVGFDLLKGLATDFAIGAVLGGGGAGIVRAFGSNALKIRATGQAIGNFRALRLPNSVWRIADNRVRGLRIERSILSRVASFDGVVAAGIRSIDDFIIKGGRGIATSIKSLDLTRKSYQTASGLRGQLNRYARDLANFTGVNRGAVRVGAAHGGHAVDDKVLVVAFEQGAATSAQANALVQWTREAVTKYPDIKVKVLFIP